MYSLKFMKALNLLGQFFTWSRSLFDRSTDGYKCCDDLFGGPPLIDFDGLLW